MQVIVAEEFRILLVPDAIVYQNEPVPVFDQQAAHGPRTQVVFVGGICSLPKRFGHHAKHGSAIQLKKTSINYVKLHALNSSL